MGGGKGGSVTPQTNPYSAEQSKLAEQYWTETDPLRQQLIDKYSNVASGNYNVTNDPMFQTLYQPSYAAGRTGLEAQYDTAKKNLFGNVAPGGALTQQLGQLEGARASDVGTLPSKLTQQIGGGIIQDISNQAYGLASGSPAVSIGGLGSAGATYQSALNQQMASTNAAKGGLGSGIGSIMGQGLGGWAGSSSGSQAITGALSGCCFIFIAANGGILDPVVRRYRDEHLTPRNRRGYYWLADRLVPLMERYRVIHKAVQWFMVNPMTCYGRYFYRENRIGILFKPVAAMWLKVYDLLGNRPPYMRRGTREVV